MLTLGNDDADLVQQVIGLRCGRVDLENDASDADALQFLIDCFDLNIARRLVQLKIALLVGCILQFRFAVTFQSDFRGFSVS